MLKDLELLKHHADLVKSLAGCGDNSCLFTRPQGMGTNGGCTCLGHGGKPFLRAALAQLLEAAERVCAVDAPPSVCSLESRLQIKEARDLLTRVFGGSPRIRRTHRLFGIYEQGLLRAVTGVETAGLEEWRTRTKRASALPQTPMAAISFTAVHPDFRRRGFARALRIHLQTLYQSLVTATGPKSNLAAMTHLNETTGFRRIWSKGKSTLWFWSRA